MERHAHLRADYIPSLVTPPKGRRDKMRVAKNHFRVPTWLVMHGDHGGQATVPSVVETYGSMPPGGGCLVLVRQVDPADWTWPIRGLCNRWCLVPPMT